MRVTPLACLVSLGAGLTSTAPCAEERPLTPFFAHYTANWRGIDVGTSDLELRREPAPGTYLYTWTMTAHGVFRIARANDVVQKSWFAVVRDHVRPLKYRAEDGPSTASIDFDWDAGRARGQSQREPIDLELREGTQDIMSIQIEVMLDLHNGHLPTAFRILDKDAIKDFEYAEEAPARIRTALGEFDTRVVASRRPDNDRITRMWFAPSLGYIPVLAERWRNGKLDFAMKIKSAGPAPGVPKTQP